MPRRDGNGPMGNGSMTGRGLGFCTGADTLRDGAGSGFGQGRGCRRGFGRDFSVDTSVSKTQKEWLTEQKGLLESKLNHISRQLESL